MYRTIAERLVRGVFDDLTRGDHHRVVPRLAPDVHHRFAGDHALGGERHTRDGVERWFARLYRLVGLTFTVERVAISGPPWDLVATVEWVAHVVPVHGPGYVNRGAHVIRIRRGRVTELHAYEDSQAVERALRILVEHGVDEAAAAPIAT